MDKHFCVPKIDREISTGGKHSQQAECSRETLSLSVRFIVAMIDIPQIWTGWLLHILVFYLVIGTSTGKTYKLGAIFDSKNSLQEEAMRQALREINEEDPEIRLEAVVKHMEGTNPFEVISHTCALLEEAVVGILGPISEENSNVVQSICDLKEIPHIDVRWDDHPLNGTMVNVHPYPDTLTRTYFDLIKSWGWKDFVILYENNESLQRVGELLKLFEPITQKVVIRQLDPSKLNNYRPVLKEVWKSGATHFVLDCTSEILGEVLKQAQQIGLVTYEHHYIITNLDLHTIDLTPFQYSETNITGMRFVDPENEYLRKTVCNIKNEPDCYNPMEGFNLKLEEALTFDAVKMFAASIKAVKSIVHPVSISCWNENDKLPTGTTIVNIMKNLDYPGLTGRIKFDVKGLRTNFALDIIELMEGGQTIVGTWNSTARPPLNISRSIPEKDDSYLDIRNQTFRVITALTEPYGMRVESADPLYGNDQYEGFAIDLIKELSVMRGFNYTFLIREDKANGEYKNETGKWTGMIGDVYYGVADLAISDLTITMERESIVDFTTQFMSLGISILYQKPKKAPPSFFSFAAPFAFEVWKLLMMAWVGISLVLFIIGRISPSEWENPYPCIEEPEYLVNQLDLRNCFWFVTGSIMQQGSEIELKSPPTRMVAGMWWFFTLLMVSSYTANLAAFLTTEKPDPHFSNLKELIEVAEDKGIKFGAKSGGATANFFRDKAKSDENSDFAKAWRYMEAHKDEVMVSENKFGVQKAQKEKYAFFMEDCSIEYEVQRKCDLNQVAGKLDEKGYGIAMRKNAPYRNSLSTAILQMQNSGKLDELKRRWWEERKGGGQCFADAGSADATPLNLKGVGGVFWVTIGGCILAFFLAMIETVLNVGKKSIRTKIPFSEVMKEEIKCYFRFGEMVKKVAPEREFSASSERSPDKEVPYGGLHKQGSVESFRSNRSTKSRKSKRPRRTSTRSRSRSRSRNYGKRGDKRLS